MKNKTLVIMAHSNPNDSTVNKKIKETLEDEENIIYKDIKSLYKNFDFDIEKEQNDLVNVDKVVFQFPLYWFTAPSILKQWTDDVFTNGFAFTYDENGTWQTLKLQDKKFQMLVTIGASEEEYQQMGVKVKECLTSYSTTAYSLGMKELDPYYIYGIDSVKYTSEQLDVIMEEVKEHIL